MVKKCQRGKTLQEGRCVNKRSVNPFKSNNFLTKFFLWATISMIVLSALMGAGFLLFGAFNETTAKILLTTLTLGIVSLLGLVSGNNDNNILKISGLIVSIIAGVLWLLFIWNVFNFTDESMLRLTLAISIIAFVLAHTSILSKSRSSDNLVRVIFWIVVALIIAVAGMLIYVVFNEEIFRVSATFWRILGAIAVLDVAGSIALPILKKVRG